MSLSTKIMLFLFGLFVVGMAGFVIYQEHLMSVRQTAIEQQMVAQKQLADNITRSMAEWTTKSDLAKFAKDNKIDMAAIQSDLAKLNASVSAINVSTATSNGQIANNLPSTHTSPGPNTGPTPTVDCNGKQVPCADTYGYQMNQQMLRLNEDFGTTQVPFGDVGFSAWQSKPWNINILPRKYTSITVLGVDENQRSYAYNKFSVNVDSKDYELKIASSQIQQIFPEPKFTFWNPRLYLGVDAGINMTALKGSAGPSLNVQIMSYGKYKDEPDISILQIGAAYDMIAQKPAGILMPFGYNIGQHLPLMKSVILGPSLQLNTAGDFSATVGLRVGL